MRVFLPKQKKGQYFPNLDLLSRLTVGNEKKLKKPKITELEDENDEKIEIISDSSISETTILLGNRYGFNNQYCELFNGFEEMGLLKDMILATNDEQNLENFLLKASISEKRERMCEVEDSMFDENRYMGDFLVQDKKLCEENEIDIYEHESFLEMLSYKPFWINEKASDLARKFEMTEFFAEAKNDKYFSDPERKIISTLKAKTFKFQSEDSRQEHLLGLISILYSYCYVLHVGMGDVSEEALYSISTISMTLSHFLLPQDLEDLVQSLSRRTMVFPLIRNWKLFAQSLLETAELLECGKRPTFKAMLQLIQHFGNHEDAWRISKSWLEDYAIWVHSDGLKESELMELSKNLRKVALGSMNNDVLKSKIEIGGWNLLGLENIVMDSACEFSENEASEEENQLIENQKTKPLIELL